MVNSMDPETGRSDLSVKLDVPTPAGVNQLTTADYREEASLNTLDC